MHAALLLLHRLPVGWRGLPEEFRPFVTNEIGYPTKPNAWGSLTRIAKVRGLIRPTGNRMQMRAVKSHARMTDEYEKVG